jgi:inner membrane transporter RhtA
MPGCSILYYLFMKEVATRFGVPPTGLVILAVISTQIGSALAKSLFQEVGPVGIVFLRVSLAAGILFLAWRPRWQLSVWQHGKTLAAFGTSLALMNLIFYLAIARIPLGIAVALEFIGPLGLAAVKSHRWLDVVWVVLAGIGVLLLAPIGGFELDWLGVGLALLAGGCWASYILLSAATGRVLSGIDGLVWAMAFGACLLAPVGIGLTGMNLLNGQVLAIATGVALLSSAIPYGLELTALRRLPVTVFGVLLSVEPMAAAIAGFLILGETITPRAIAAILLISVAAAGAARCRTPDH